MPTQPQKHEVIVQGAAVATEAFMAAIGRRATIEFVKKLATDIVVLRATQSDSDALKAQFPGLIVESDEELKY